MHWIVFGQCAGCRTCSKSVTRSTIFRRSCHGSRPQKRSAQSGRITDLVIDAHRERLPGTVLSRSHGRLPKNSLAPPKESQILSVTLTAETFLPGPEEMQILSRTTTDRFADLLCHGFVLSRICFVTDLLCHGFVLAQVRSVRMHTNSRYRIAER